MYKTIDDVKRANARIGHYFFHPDTMRFFASRIGSTLYCGECFITSERDTLTGQRRRYTVRRVTPTGSIETVGEFQAYATRRQAERAVWTYLNGKGA